MFKSNCPCYLGGLLVLLDPLKLRIITVTYDVTEGTALRSSTDCRVVVGPGLATAASNLIYF